MPPDGNQAKVIEMELNSKPTATIPSLRSNVAWSFAGNVILAVSQWGMFILLARYTSEVSVGQLALALAITTPLFTLTNLQLSALVATDPNEQYSYIEYRWLRICGILVAAVLSGLIGMLIARVPESRLIVLLFVLGKIAESWSDLQFGYSQRAERMDRIAQSLMLRGLLSMIAGVCGVLSPAAPAVVCAACFSLGRWVVLVLFDMRQTPPRINDSRYPASVSRVGTLFITALPLGVVALLVSLDLHIVRMFVQVYQGERGVGVFSMLTYFLLIGGLVFNAIGQSLTPRLAKLVQAQQRREFYQLWSRYLQATATVSVTFAAIITMWGSNLVAMLYGPAYTAAEEALLWLMWGTVLRDISAPLGYAATSMRCFKPQPINLLISTAVVAAGCWILIPSTGLLGASQAYCAGMFVKTIGKVIILVFADKMAFGDALRPAPFTSLDRAA